MHGALTMTTTVSNERKMRARSRAVVARGGRVAHLYSEPPLTIRKVFTEKQGESALCMVGSAAGPLPGDDLRLDLEIQDGGHASLSATGASVAQGQPGVSSSAKAAARLHTCVVLGAEASLVADPGALVICAGANVDVELEIALTTSATLTWRETLVLGRRDEPAGFATLTWNVLRDGRALLRQHLDLRESHLRSWEGMTRKHKVITTELRVGINDAQTIVHSPTDVTQQIADDATLRTTLLS